MLGRLCNERGGKGQNATSPSLPKGTLQRPDPGHETSSDTYWVKDLGLGNEGWDRQFLSTRQELTASGSPEEEYVSGVDYLSGLERQRQALSSSRDSVNGEKNQRLQKTSATSITFKKASPLFPEGEGSQHAPVWVVLHSGSCSHFSILPLGFRLLIY